MTVPFVAVVPFGFETGRAVLLAAGATAVLSWPELAASTEPDDAVAVLFDQSVLLEPADGSPAVQLPPELVADLAAALGALAAVDSATGAGGAVIATTRPVTDTLKRVDSAGTLTGTAERDDHRFVLAPIAARLQLLRSIADVEPNPVGVLAALAGRGATVIGVSG